MALKKPLVITSGEIEQLQPGDDLNVPIAGAIEISLTNDEATPIVIGAPVYSDANGGVKKARANALGTSIVVGIVNDDPSIAAATSGSIATSGVMTATTTQWDAVTGQVGGLTFGTRYYLDAATAGKLTITAPTTAGNQVVEIGIAMSTIDMKIAIQKRIKL